MTGPHVPSPAVTAASWLSYLSEIPTALLIQAQWSGGMPYHRSGDVPGRVEDPTALLPEGFELRVDQSEDGDRRIVAGWPGLLAQVAVENEVTSFEVVGAQLPEVQALLERLLTGARAVTRVPAGSLRMHFWTLRKDVARMSTRRIEAPEWEEVAGNYARTTAAGLADLMTADDVPARAGRLVLWHGAPGTGKTTAVRALSSAWSDWCRPHYVMDPERLFAEPHYLLQLAEQDEDDEDDDAWRLVIAEDCDEYLRADAKLRAGASLGRLLNLCDGILGHGLKVLVLLTTNEEVGRLHPAITRPGRCLSAVEFAPLPPAEARAWLGTDAAAPEAPLTLAELFALREQRAGAVPADAALGGYL